MMLVVGAVTLLSLVALSISQMLVGQTQNVLDSEASFNAITIAQSLLDEIQTKLYEDTTRSVRVFDTQVTTLFADADHVGPTWWKRRAVPLPDSAYPHRSPNIYTMVNDYNGYVRVDTTTMMQGFRSSVSVYYVSESNPDQRSEIPTCFKRIDIVVSHPSMKHSVLVSDITVYRRFFN